MKTDFTNRMKKVNSNFKSYEAIIKEKPADVKSEIEGFHEDVKALVTGAQPYLPNVLGSNS
jgi:hypothetical protein